MRRDRGFTLLEILCAMAIVATALVALLGLQGRNIRRVADNHEITRATFLAEGALARFLAETPFPDVSEDSGDFADDEGYQWAVAVLPGPVGELEDQMREVRLRVWWNEDDPEGVLLVTHVRAPESP